MKIRILLCVVVALVAVLVIGLTDYVNNNTFPNLTITGSFTNSSMASQPLAVDSNGKMVPMVMGSGLSWDGSALSMSSVANGSFYRAGTTNIGSLSLSQAILFSSPLSSASYTPVVSSLFALGGASFSYSAITTNGFTVNLSSGIVGGGQINYAAILSN